MFLNQKKLNFYVLGKLCLLGIVGILVGCAATHTAINKRSLDVQTKMSESIFLDPVVPSKKTIFVQIRNTSDKPELDLAEGILASVMAKGYQVVQDPEQAHYLLQANILQAGKADLRATEHALQNGFGSAVGGAVAGAATGALVSNKPGGMVAGGLLGAAISTITDAMVHDTMYSVVADIQVSERVGNAITVKEKTRATLTQGTSGVKEITATERVNWKRYQTRIVSEANQVNLKFEKAAPALVSGLTRSISGIF
jgi:hypothetical protein